MLEEKDWQQQVKPTVDTVVNKPVVEQLPEKTIGQKIWEDIHINASGLFMFVCLGIGVFSTDLKPKMTELAALAGTYLFASAKKKD
jgi:hypothetical protein